MIAQHGPHRVRHGDATDPGAIRDLLGGETAQIIYTDPPWGEGMMKYWATLLKRHTGRDVVPVTLDGLLGAVFQAAREFCSHYLIVENGLKWRDTIQAAARTAGFYPRMILPTVYGSPSKPLRMEVHAFTRTPLMPFPDEIADAVTNTHGLATVSNMLGPLIQELWRQGHRSPIVLDPCCGLGTTARAALEHGARFYGNELNEVRLSKTVEILMKN